jgi:hypothetical protein
MKYARSLFEAPPSAAEDSEKRALHCICACSDAKYWGNFRNLLNASGNSSTQNARELFGKGILE